MESKKFSSVRNSDDAESSSTDISSEKRKKLEKKIKELINVVQRLKVQNVTTKRSLTKNGISDASYIGNAVTPIDVQFELYKFGGLYCMKSTKDQKVVGFNSSAKNQHENEFAVQFIKQGKNIITGKWVMPMSVDIETLLSEVPIMNMQNILHFIRNCKQHIDCHESRLQQFKELKSSADNLRDCNVQTNLGYILVTLELLRVHDKINNNYFNVAIYLWYNSKGARPAITKVEILSDSTECSNETEKRLKKSLKIFRSSDLQIAFNTIFNKNNTDFTWERAKKEDEILEIDESISSLDDEVPTYKRPLQEKKIRKRPKTKLKKQSKKKKVDDSNDGSNEKKIETVEKINKPTNSKARLTVTRNTVKSTLSHQSTLDKFMNKLQLRSKKISDPKTIENKHNIKPVLIVAQKLNVKLSTSTPIKSNPQSKTPFKVLPSIDISNINMNNSFT